MNKKLSTADYEAWLASPLTKALKQSHQDKVDAIEKEWLNKCQRYIEIHDAVVKDNDRALDLLRRAETEMRYAGWTKYENDNSARNGVYEQIKQFLEKPV
jgi:coproporphyrinogen III oxidase-like Fe-S oxidoreductase